MVKACKIALFVLAVSFFPLTVSAATFSFSRPAASYKVGSTFSVTAYVSSADQAMNAASGTISFSSDKIQAISVSKSGSIFSFWAQEPSIGASTVSFAGIVPSPGYKGGGGKVATITFRAKAPGTARVSLSGGSILANDGNGTNIYTGAGSSTITIVAADPATPSPETKPTTPETPVTPTVQPEVTPVAQPGLLLAAPIITYYPEETAAGSPIKIRGTTQPNSGVSLRITQEGAVISEEKAVSNDSGEFLVIVSKSLEPGVYAFTAQVTDPAGQQSKESSPLGFIVTPKAPADMTALILQYLALIALGLLALIGAITIGIFVRHWLRVLIRRHEGKMLAHSLGIMREHMGAYIEHSKSSKDKRKLTNGNIQFLEKFAKASVQAENIIMENFKKAPVKKSLPKKPLPKKSLSKKSLK